jgi:hypothetical protein
MGDVYLASGQYSQAITMWNKALGLGGTLALDAWYSKSNRYQKGAFKLSNKEISFASPDQGKVFSAAPSEASSVKFQKSIETDSWWLRMKVGGHQYWFSFVPVGVACETPVRCADAAGYDQERAVAIYTGLKILASGGTAK